MLFSQDRINISSPIKWAGGKKFIIEKIRPFIIVNNNKKCFVECFAGSLALTIEFQPKNAIINDLNFPLINMWIIIKERCDELCEQLKVLADDKIYNNIDKFNMIKKEFNEMKNKKLDMKEKILLAGYFIYLNKRSFNGLYRENKSGFYNVPFRYYKNSELYNEFNIRNISKYFNNNDVRFFCGKYNDLKIPKDSLVYFDPPYYPSETSSFTAYTKEGFSIENQKDLIKFCDELDKKGIKFIESNAPCMEIMEMYKKYNLDTFYIQRSMRSAKEGIENKEKTDNEILIWN